MTTTMFFLHLKRKSTFRVRLCWVVKETVSSLVISTWQKKPQARKEGEETKLKIQYSTHHLLWFPTQLVLCQLQMSFCFYPKTEKKKKKNLYILIPKSWKTSCKYYNQKKTNRTSHISILCLLVLYYRASSHPKLRVPAIRKILLLCNGLSGARVTAVK